MLKVIIVIFIGVVIGYFLAALTYSASTYSRDGEDKLFPTRGFEFISQKQTNIDFNNLNYCIKLPKRSTKNSAGYDFYAPYDIHLNPGEDIKIPTGIRAYMQEDEVLMIYPRSGLGFKYYTRLANSIGIIDSDYYYSDNEGHIWVKLRNEGDKELVINKGEAFCQGIFTKYLLVDGDDFENGKERNGGFGSTSEKGE